MEWIEVHACTNCTAAAALCPDLQGRPPTGHTQVAVLAMLVRLQVFT